MKKVRFLALALVAAMALTGAGYAYWTDTLTINNTVTTGELNVQFTDGTVAVKSEDGTERDYVEENVLNEEEKTVSLEMLNLYPGASVNFDARFENTGSIPAVIDAISLVDDKTSVPVGKTYITEAEKKSILVSGTVIHFNKDGVKKRGYGVPANVNVNLANLDSYLNYAEDQLRLEPKDYVVLDLTLTLDSNLVDDQVENVYVKSDVTIDFRQHNAQQ